MRYCILLLIFFESCAGSPPDCQNFKIGIFKFKAEVDGKIETTVFSRGDSLEISTFRGVADTAYVHWVSGCEYTLRKIHPKTISDRKALHFKIIATTEDTYTFEYGIVGDLRNKQRGVAKRIK